MNSVSKKQSSYFMTPTKKDYNFSTSTRNTLTLLLQRDSPMRPRCHPILKHNLHRISCIVHPTRTNNSFTVGYTHYKTINFESVKSISDFIVNCRTTKGLSCWISWVSTWMNISRSDTLLAT